MVRAAVSRACTPLMPKRSASISMSLSPAPAETTTVVPETAAVNDAFAFTSVANALATLAAVSTPDAVCENVTGLSPSASLMVIEYAAFATICAPLNSTVRVSMVTADVSAPAVTEMTLPIALAV